MRMLLIVLMLAAGAAEARQTRANALGARTPIMRSAARASGNAKIAAKPLKGARALGGWTSNVIKKGPETIRKVISNGTRSGGKIAKLALGLSKRGLSRLNDERGGVDIGYAVAMGLAAGGLIGGAAAGLIGAQALGAGLIGIGGGLAAGTAAGGVLGLGLAHTAIAVQHFP